VASDPQNKPSAVSLELSAESRKARFLRKLDDYKRHLDAAAALHNQTQIVQNVDQHASQVERCKCVLCKASNVKVWVQRQLLKFGATIASLLGHKSHQQFDLLQHTFNRDIFVGHGTSSARVGGELNGTSLAGEEVS